MKKFVNVVLVAIICVLSAVSAGADQRNYVWTYEYSTVSKGNAEIEFYSTAVAKNTPTGKATEWKQQVELEYGVTDHLDVSMYQVFKQPAQSSGSTMSYDGYKLRLRYRLLEKNELPLDILFYAEHVANTEGENEFEGKLVLAKDLGKLNIAYNQVIEQGYSSGHAEHGYAAGMSYEILPSLRIGLESKGNYTNDKFSVGPTLAWAGGRIWANLGVVYGINNNTADREVRFLLGIPF